jgi:hypothetical protein
VDNSVFKLPSDFLDSRTRGLDIPIPKPHVAKEPIKYPFLHPAHKKLVIALAVVVIYSSSFFTWTSLVIVDKGIVAASEIFAYSLTNPLALFTLQAAPLANYSHLALTTDPNLRAVVTFPQSKQVGVDSYNAIYKEFPSSHVEILTLFEEKANTPFPIQKNRVIIRATNLPTGRYLLTFSTESAGRYAFQLLVSDQNNLYTKDLSRTITVAVGKPTEYWLYYDKDDVEKSILVPKTNLPWWLNGLRKSPQ